MGWSVRIPARGSTQKEGKKISRELRINQKIRAPQVRVIDESGEQLGVLPLFEALRLAQDRDLDLVEVAPNSVPPVCRLLDYGKFKFEQEKKEREARKHQKAAMLKEVRLTPTTDEGDIETKVRTIQRFLEEGDKVKVTVRFKGRELAHPQLGRQALETIAGKLQGAGVVERMPLMEGRMMTMMLTPVGGVRRAARPPQPPTGDGDRREAV